MNWSRGEAFSPSPMGCLQDAYATYINSPSYGVIIAIPTGQQKWLRKSEQGDKWNRCLIEGMIVLSETGARDEQTTPP